MNVGIDPELYRRVAEGLPEVWLEDPALTPETEPVLAPHASRITWDAPIRSVADITALSVRPRMVNMKSSRFGTIETLLETLDFLEVEGIGAYGGGQFELGPGRGQIQHLAALFHADAPNDVAPRAYGRTSTRRCSASSRAASVTATPPRTSSRRSALRGEQRPGWAGAECGG